MKKLALTLVAVVTLASLTACNGIRGYHGKTPVCENEAFLGLSIIEIVSPCKAK